MQEPIDNRVFCEVSGYEIRAARKPDTDADTLSRRQEKLALIRILRDETQSADVHARCVAIVGVAS